MAVSTCAADGSDGNTGRQHRMITIAGGCLDIARSLITLNKIELIKMRSVDQAVAWAACSDRAISGPLAPVIKGQQRSLGRAGQRP